MKLFDPRTIGPGTKCVLIGAQNLGKTHLIGHLCDFAKRVHVQTGIEYDVEFYSRCLHNRGYSSIVETEYNESLIEQHLNTDDCDAIVLDNCIYSMEPFESDVFRRLMTQKRITVFIAMLYGMGAPAEIRQLFDYVFIFRDPIIHNQQRLFTLYCNPRLIVSREALGSILREVTEEMDGGEFTRILDGGCLVLTRNSVSRYCAPKKLNS